MIEKLKFEMGGAGAVLGAARCIGGLAPPGVEVHFIIAACENMVSAEAMRPGDILTASNSKTIEVLNTDAEGRLTLADALVYADRLGDVDAIVDIATLTGACIVAALGTEKSSARWPAAFAPLRTAYGAGTKSWHDRPNLLRLVLGETAREPAA